MFLRKLFEDDLGVVTADAQEVVKAIPTTVKSELGGLEGAFNTGKEYLTNLGGQLKDFGVDVGNKASEIINGLRQTASDTQAKGVEVTQDAGQQASGLASDFKSMSVPEFIQAHPNISAGVGVPAAALMGLGALALSKRLKRQ